LPKHEVPFLHSLLNITTERHHDRSPFRSQSRASHQARYLQLAAELKPLLADIDGFIDIERFQSLTTDGKILSLSWWRDEEAIRRWKQNVFHQAAQAEGRDRFLRTTAFAWRRWCGNTVPKTEGSDV
jgi:heme-degrading monooxygenase HmoA